MAFGDRNENAEGLRTIKIMVDYDSFDTFVWWGNNKL
jgi:hypothetical protein